MHPSSTKLLVLDTETTMHCKREGYSSSFPFDPDNHLICMAACRIDDENIVSTGWITSDSDAVDFRLFVERCANQPGFILVGHNIRFDLNYIRREMPSLARVLDTMPVWDTQVAEYILSGQLKLFPSLDDCAKTYFKDGSKLKNSYLDDAIKEGKTTQELPMKDLLTYCFSDVELTGDVALEQMKLAYRYDPKLIPLIVMHSSVSKVLSEMEMHGLHYDARIAGEAYVELAKQMVTVSNDLIADVRDYIAMTIGSNEEATTITNNFQSFSGSNSFWSAYFFGGEYTFTWKEEGGVWKSGSRKGHTKYSHKERSVTFKSTYSPANYGSERTKTGDWTMDDAVLTRLSHHSSEATNLRKYRSLNKLANTYFSSLPKHLFNGVLHPTIHQCSTRTGRFSQSKPNLQNVANEPLVKRCFVPSSPDLCFVEADYKQLEMNVFAYLYRDEQLLYDLRSGIDIHAMIGRDLYGVDYTETKRRNVKGVVFGMIYGGGAKTLSEQSGLPQKDVEAVIKLFNKRYRGIHPVRYTYVNNASVAGKAGRMITYENNKHYMLPSTTARRYAILMNKKVTSSGIEWEPSYTNLCNYPIQGLATGDIVPMMLLHLWTEIRKESRPITMVNTVHDSILFEVPRCDVQNQMDWIKTQLELAPQRFEEWFGSPFDLDLPVKVQYSKESWAGPWVEWTPF